MTGTQMATVDSSYIIHGVSADVPPVTESLGEFYYKRLEEHGEHVAQIEVAGVETVITYAQILQRARAVSHLLRLHRLRVGDTVLLCCGNSTDYAPVMLGTLFVGAAIAPVNPALDADDLLHLLHVIQPQLVITDTEAEASVTAALARHVSPIPLVDFATLHEAYTVATDARDFHVAKIDAADLAEHVAFVMCSSGTSGRPKGVEMTHAAVLSQLHGLKYVSIKDANVVQTVAINISGPYWITCMFVTLFSLHLGYKLVLLAKFDARIFLETIQKYKVNFSLTSPALIYGINKLSDAEQYDVSSLKVATCGGGPTSATALEQVKQKLKINISLSYAMTEAPSVVQVALGPLSRPGSVGYPFANVDLKVVDVDTGKPLPPNQPGELCFKARTLMKGYRGNPEATSEVFDEDGFFHSGDIAYYEPDGYVYIVDRIKELIKNKGHHVPAVDIEEVLMEHRDVAEAAVVGIEHETDWEHATAFVVTSPGSTVTADELVTLVEGKLSSLKWLYGGVRFISSLPKTATGKIRKRDLRTLIKSI